MNILVNGYFYGSNCPPFVRSLKSINPDIKLTNSLSILDEHGINKDYLEYEDIIKLKLNFIERSIVLISKKVRLPFWKICLIRKAKKLIKEYKPDIIINHKASEKAEIMLKTGFRPQLTYIYGGEVQGDRLMKKGLAYILKKSTYIITTTEQMKYYLSDKFNSLKNKIKVYPFGNSDLENILKYKDTNRKEDIKQKYGFKLNDTVIFDNRSLRGSHSGFHSIIEALKILAEKKIQIKIFFLRGFLGTDYMIKQLHNIKKNNPNLENHILLIDDIVSTDQIIEYYYLSDAFISLLPTDQFGKSISDAVLLDCSLILSDLDVYKFHLGNGPAYITNQNPNQLAKTFESITYGKSFKVDRTNYEQLKENFNPEIRFKNLYGFLDKLISKKI